MKSAIISSPRQQSLGSRERLQEPSDLLSEALWNEAIHQPPPPSPRAVLGKEWMFAFLREEDGPTAVEYAVMLGMIVLACLGSIMAVGQQTSSSLTDSAGKLEQAFSP